VGLLILPQQLWFEKLSSDLINEKEWGLSLHHISLLTKNEIKSVKTIVTHLRNSVAHYNFYAFSNKKDEISSIQFIDKDKYGRKTFEATIPVKNLNKFMGLFSNNILELMDESK
jgi:hypothetical protein